MPFLLMFWKPLAGILLIAALAAGALFAKHGYDERRREEGRAEIRAEWKADTERRVAMTTAITNEWNAKRIEAETAIGERDRERAQRQADNQARARALPPAVAGGHFSGVAVSVLNRAASDSAAAAEPAGATARAAPAAADDSDDSDATVGAVVEWGVTLIGMYETCRTRVGEWQEFYAALQAAQPKGADP